MPSQSLLTNAFRFTETPAVATQIEDILDDKGLVLREDSNSSTGEQVTLYLDLLASPLARAMVYGAIQKNRPALEKLLDKNLIDAMQLTLEANQTPNEAPVLYIPNPLLKMDLSAEEKSALPEELASKNILSSKDFTQFGDVFRRIFELRLTPNEAARTPQGIERVVSTMGYSAYVMTYFSDPSRFSPPVMASFPGDGSAISLPPEGPQSLPNAEYTIPEDQRHELSRGELKSLTEFLELTPLHPEVLEEPSSELEKSLNPGEKGVFAFPYLAAGDSEPIVVRLEIFNSLDGIIYLSVCEAQKGENFDPRSLPASQWGDLLVNIIARKKYTQSLPVPLRTIVVLSRIPDGENNFNASAFRIDGSKEAIALSETELQSITKRESFRKAKTNSTTSELYRLRWAEMSRHAPKAEMPYKPGNLAKQIRDGLRVPQNFSELNFLFDIRKTGTDDEILEDLIRQINLLKSTQPHAALCKALGEQLMAYYVIRHDLPSSVPPFSEYITFYLTPKDSSSASKATIKSDPKKITAFDYVKGILFKSHQHESIRSSNLTTLNDIFEKRAEIAKRFESLVEEAKRVTE